MRSRPWRPSRPRRAARRCIARRTAGWPGSAPPGAAAEAAEARRRPTSRRKRSVSALTAELAAAAEAERPAADGGRRRRGGRRRGRPTASRAGCRPARIAEKLAALERRRGSRRTSTSSRCPTTRTPRPKPWRAVVADAEAALVAGRCRLRGGAAGARRPRGAANGGAGAAWPRSRTSAEPVDESADRRGDRVVPPGPAGRPARRLPRRVAAAAARRRPRRARRGPARPRPRPARAHGRRGAGDRRLRRPAGGLLGRSWPARSGRRSCVPSPPEVAPSARSSGREDHLTSPDPPRSGGAVAVITEAAIRELAGIRGDVAPITSCYLDVDGRRLARHQDVEHELDGVLRERRARANGHRSVHDDLRRIEAFVRAGSTATRPAGWRSSRARRRTCGR